LTGMIPGELGDLTKLLTLTVSSNALTGTPPLSITRLSVLTATDFGYNALWTQDLSVRDFLNDVDPNWADTQTVPPVLNNVTILAPDSVRVNWKPISYTQDGGHYQVYYGLTSGGPYTPLAGTTSDKSVSSYVVNGLTPEANYFFVVDTYTPANANNVNPLTSTLSNEVSAVPTEASFVYLPLVMRN